MDRIYVAGFDVFYPDWKEKRYFVYQELCSKYGFEMQAQKAAADEGKTLGERIFLKNIHYLDNCEYVVANLNTFRGMEPDSGTCFEIGYAYALGKKIYGYLDDGRTMLEKVGARADANGFTVEDFDLPVNLMLGCSMTVVTGNLEHCLRVIRDREGHLAKVDVYKRQPISRHGRPDMISRRPARHDFRTHPGACRGHIWIANQA